MISHLSRSTRHSTPTADFSIQVDTFSKKASETSRSGRYVSIGDAKTTEDTRHRWEGKKGGWGKKGQKPFSTARNRRGSTAARRPMPRPLLFLSIGKPALQGLLAFPRRSARQQALNADVFV